jgi:prepilin signal peptidase PulO-like enzyme (type II secretory pathway)
MTCRNRLGPGELIPVFSFLWQRGRCRHCGTRISWQYPLVELATGILFAANFYYQYQHVSSVLQLGVAYVLTSCVLALFVAIFVYDLRHRIIPDVFSLSAFGISVAYVLATVYFFRDGSVLVGDGTLLVVLGLGAGILFYGAIYLLWKLSRGRLIGLGDAKLLLSIGTMLGLVYGLSAVFLSFWIGTVFAVCLMLKAYLGKSDERITMRTEIAFGPLLIVGLLIVYFFRIDVTNLAFLLENL